MTDAIDRSINDDWTGSLYVLMAAFTCGGDVAVLMLGRSRAAYHQVA